MPDSSKKTHPPDPPDSPPQNHGKSGIGPLRLTYLLSRALVRDAAARRGIMMWSMMTAVVMLFIGWVFLDAWLMERKLLFVLYWLVCAGVTIFAALMAIFDILIHISTARARAKSLRREMLLREIEEIQEKQNDKTRDEKDH